MNDSDWRQLEPHVDGINELVEELLTGRDTDTLRSALHKAAALVAGRYGMEIEVTLSVFDWERGQSIPLTSLSLYTEDGAEPGLATGDSAAQRYVVDGEVCELPQDRCPNCWRPWEFKLGFPGWAAPSCACPECGYELGNEIKVLLDGDRCPVCKSGQVSVDQPTCAECGYTVDPSFVAWG